MLIVVTGGSGSGKSAYAEERICRLFKETEKRGELLYIATMFPYDQESFVRIERHQKMRAGKGFRTVECYRDLASLEIPEGSCILLECMSNLVANEMFQENGAKENTVSQVITGVEHLLERAAHVCIVTNEIFSEEIPYAGDTRRYQEYLGGVNCALGKRADQVVEVVYGIGIFQKGEQDEDFVEQF